jgi:hypothetical protein
MSEAWNNQDPESAKADRMEADAVCIACEAVNPEGTLFCKSCGNNLRDQRMQRMQNIGAIPPPEHSKSAESWLRGLLALFGFLLIIVVFMYVENFENWLRQRIENTDSGENPGVYWTGGDKPDYDALASRLDDYSPTPAERSAALDSPVPDTVIETGRYLIVQEHPLTGKMVIGQAEVKSADGSARFVVRFGRHIEARGEISTDPDGRLKSEGDSGVLMEGVYYLAGGIATRMPSGAYQCYAQSAVDSFTYDAVAYRVSSEETAPATAKTDEK